MLSRIHCLHSDGGCSRIIRNENIPAHHGFKMTVDECKVDCGVSFMPRHEIIGRAPGIAEPAAAGRFPDAVQTDKPAVISRRAVGSEGGNRVIRHESCVCRIRLPLPDGPRAKPDAFFLSIPGWHIPEIAVRITRRGIDRGIRTGQETDEWGF